MNKLIKNWQMCPTVLLGSWWCQHSFPSVQHRVLRKTHYKVLNLMSGEGEKTLQGAKSQEWGRW
jgi:hypothetical protein